MKISVKSILIFLALFQQGASVLGQVGGDYNPKFPGDTGKESKIIWNLEHANNLKDTDIKQALVYAMQALDEAKQINSDKLIAESSLVLGTCYDNIGADHEALDYLNDALAIFSQENDLHKKALTLELIGYVYYYSNEFPVALEYFRKVYDLGRELQDSMLLIKGLIGRGSVCGNTNKMDSAMILFNESLDLAKRYGDNVSEVQSSFYIGDVYLFSGEARKALEVFKDVEENYDLKTINPDLLSNLYNSITGAAIMINVPEMAKHYNQLTLKVLNKNSRLQRKRDYYRYKFQIDTMTGDYKSAIEDLISYRTLYDSINNSEFRKNLDNLNTIYELRQRENEIVQLKAENSLNDLRIRQRRLTNYGSAALFLLLSVIIYQILRTNRKIKEKNIVLQSRGEELKTTLLNLQNTQNQLIQSEKMAALGILASGVSHEINNPLNYIIGGVDCIKDHCDKNHNQDNKGIDIYINAIRTGVEKVSAIIHGLNRFSRSGESIQKSLDIHNVCNTCVLMLNYLTENRINIVKDYSDRPCFVYGVEANMHQIILSILLNAIQSIDSKGTIIIKTEARGTKVIIQITDTGCGISKENLPKIMDPFFTTKDPGEGTGLGLSITYKMLKEHNGTIDIHSGPGIGTTVTIGLPLIQ